MQPAGRRASRAGPGRVMADAGVLWLWRRRLAGGCGRKAFSLAFLLPASQTASLRSLSLCPKCPSLPGFIRNIQMSVEAQTPTKALDTCCAHVHTHVPRDLPLPEPLEPLTQRTGRGPWRGLKKARVSARRPSQFSLSLTFGLPSPCPPKIC